MSVWDLIEYVTGRTGATPTSRQRDQAARAGIVFLLALGVNPTEDI